MQEVFLLPNSGVSLLISGGLELVISYTKELSLPVLDAFSPSPYYHDTSVTSRPFLSERLECAVPDSTTYRGGTTPALNTRWTITALS